MKYLNRLNWLAVGGLLATLSIGAAQAQSYEVVQFRSDSVDIFDPNGRRIATVPQTSLTKLVGTTVTLERATSLYAAKMNDRTVLLSPDDVVAIKSGGSGIADLCAVLANNETNTDTASSYGNICN